MAQVVNDTTLIVQNTPQCLRSRHQWVCWRYEPSDTGKPTKVPYDPRSGQKASSNSHTTWTTFEQAIDAYTASENYNGVGYVLSGSDGMAGLDLDDCIREDGSLEPWAQEIVDSFQTYAEISPSERGLKLFLRGRKPDFAGCRVKNIYGTGSELEVYDHNRYFCVTGNRWPDSVTDVADCQAELDALCQRFWGRQETPASTSPPATVIVPQSRAADCLASMLALNIADKGDGSMRLYTAACRCVEHDLSDLQAVAMIRAYAQVQPFPTDWTDEQIIRRIRDAERRCRRGQALTPDDTTRPELKTVAQLLTEYPELRRPVITGLLRQGETMNIIASPKTGKSWLALDLAFAVATGRKWLGQFQTAKGDVLILDNELHQETLADRIPKVASARSIALADIAETVVVDNLRGRLKDLLALGSYFRSIEPARFKIVVLDAFYRFLPAETDENDNATMAMLYNHLDRHARDLGCCFVLIHHASKGSQSSKAVTDVGAGAGSQSRACDCHLVLRPHEEEGVVVLDAAVRSWRPVEPLCLRWTFPVWTPAPELDPTALRPERPRRRRNADTIRTEQQMPEKPKWDVDSFVSTFITADGRQADTVIGIAVEKGLSQSCVKRLLSQAVDAGKVHRWTYAANKPVRYSTQPQPLIETRSACGQV
jgi:hypothetical protein